MFAHLQVGLSQIFAPDYGWRLEGFSISMKAKRRKTLPESGTQHRSVGGAMPVCVYTQEARICVGTQKCGFVLQHKNAKLGKALSEEPQRH